MSNRTGKVWPRIAYACGTFGHDVFYAILATYFMIFVTSNLFHSGSASYDQYMIGVVTAIILVLRIAELFVDPFIGNIIDKTKTRWGRFKPWVLVGAFVAAIALALLFTDFGGLTLSHPTFYLILFAIVYFIMDIFYSAKDIAIWSMIPALSFDSHEREITATIARIGSVVGANLVAVIVMPVVLCFSANQNGGAGDATGWFAFACICGGIATLGALILGIGTREQSSALRENKTDTSAKDVIKILTQNDQLYWMAIVYLLYGIGIYIVNNFNLYYFIYVIGDTTKFSRLGVINMVIGLLAVAAFPVFTKKFSRRKLFFAAIAVMVAALLIYAMSGTDVYMALLGAGLFALPQPLVFLVVLMTITDSVEYGQLKLGHRDEAVCLCVRPLVDKFAGAVSSGIIGLVAIWIGMTGGASSAGITPENLFHFQLVMFAAPIALMVIATFLYRAKVTMTEAEHARIVAKLEETWAGSTRDKKSISRSDTQR